MQRQNFDSFFHSLCVKYLLHIKFILRIDTNKILYYDESFAQFCTMLTLAQYF